MLTFSPYSYHARPLSSPLTHRDKAGSYGIQDGLATTFVKGIRGCYFNVTGFPIQHVAKRMVALMDSVWGAEKIEQ